ncbi:hypothetical protein Prudu_021049 [Prunus dulcis]|uniref:Uncharacterized protein n=1 Tax=Prunus dulcis TaxID=3755 RepID=A0A4Y1RYD6_PRUDU|nr:hypothetical protein Prudu_021049 [Prunus dulcis]
MVDPIHWAPIFALLCFISLFSLSLSAISLSQRTQHWLRESERNSFKHTEGFTFLQVHCAAFIPDPNIPHLELLLNLICCQFCVPKT